MVVKHKHIIVSNTLTEKIILLFKKYTRAREGIVKLWKMKLCRCCEPLSQHLTFHIVRLSAPPTCYEPPFLQNCAPTDCCSLTVPQSLYNWKCNKLIHCKLTKCSQSCFRGIYQRSNLCHGWGRRSWQLTYYCTRLVVSSEAEGETPASGSTGLFYLSCN